MNVHVLYLLLAIHYRQLKWVAAVWPRQRHDDDDVNVWLISRWN